ncbi:MAG: ABC transporter permease [Lachnospiraceae bacterium]|jgi:putative aldouronate transport system permease protein
MANTTRQATHIADYKKKLKWKAFFCVLPGIILIFIFHYLPLWGWSFAFFQYRPGKKLADCAFLGFKNFEELFGNKVMRMNLIRVLTNTFGIHLLGYVFSPLPMLFAIFLSEMHSTVFKKFVQTVTTLPYFISWVIMLSLAMGIFGYNGLVNHILTSLGLIDEPVNILNSDKHVWLFQVLLQQWKGLGWNAIIYFAAITGIDPELYEAAEVDGAGRAQRIWYITIPQLIPTYFVLLIMSIGNFLNNGIDQFLAFGNSLNMEKIEVLDLYVYNLGIGNGQISYSVAVGIMKSIVALILFSGANMLSKKIRGSSVF